MNRRERFYGAVNGSEIDRVPVTVWMHFAAPYMSGVELAKRNCEFFRHYNWDLAKVVSDYRFPAVDGMTAFHTANDFARIKKVPMSHPSFAEQLNLLKGVRGELGEDWPVIDTTFDPIQQVLRRYGFSAMSLIFDNPGKAKPMIEAATETVLDYVRELKKTGVDGVFYSTRGAATQASNQGFTEAAFNDLLRPYDIAILEEMKSMVRIVHACKSHLDLSRVADYPHEVLSWADLDPTCPDMALMRAKSDKCLMGGINQTAVIEQSIAQIEANIDDAIAVNSGKNFILGPGCTVGSNVPDHVLNTISNYTRT